MRKLKNALLVSLLFVFLLSSCINHKRNFFISGKYQSTDRDIDNDTNTIYYLEIEEISYDKYIGAAGINVVKDDILKENNYFFIKFYKYTDDNNQEIINLINSKDQHPTVDAQPISYIDDNGIVIVPYYTGDKVTSKFNYYRIDHETEHIYFERIE